MGHTDRKVQKIRQTVCGAGVDRALMRQVGSVNTPRRKQRMRPFGEADEADRPPGWAG